MVSGLDSVVVADNLSTASARWRRIFEFGSVSVTLVESTLVVRCPWRYRRGQTSRRKGAGFVLTSPGSEVVQAIYSGVLSPEALKQL